ncbi:hypothetical protein ANRL3_02773 [Anaerolineae bacterium]|nr:hypothetical protein ANRL3_02773 [Anaerolineae bacterium]
MSTESRIAITAGGVADATPTTQHRALTASGPSMVRIDANPLPAPFIPSLFSPTADADTAIFFSDVSLLLEDTMAPPLGQWGMTPPSIFPRPPSQPPPRSIFSVRLSKRGNLIRHRTPVPLLASRRHPHGPA